MAAGVAQLELGGRDTGRRPAHRVHSLGGHAFKLSQQATAGIDAQQPPQGRVAADDPQFVIDHGDAERRIVHPRGGVPSVQIVDRDRRSRLVPRHTSSGGTTRI